MTLLTKIELDIIEEWRKKSIKVLKKWERRAGRQLGRYWCCYGPPEALVSKNSTAYLLLTEGKSEEYAQDLLERTREVRQKWLDDHKEERDRANESNSPTSDISVALMAGLGGNNG